MVVVTLDAHALHLTVFPFHLLAVTAASAGDSSNHYSKDNHANSSAQNVSSTAQSRKETGLVACSVVQHGLKHPCKPFLAFSSFFSHFLSPCACHVDVTSNANKQH